MRLMALGRGGLLAPPAPLLLARERGVQNWALRYRKVIDGDAQPNVLSAPESQRGLTPGLQCRDEATGVYT